MTYKAPESLSIGQVIFVLSENAQKIVPVVVVEEVTVKKLDGNVTTWKVSVGPQGKAKIVDSSRLNGEIYVSLDEVREVMKKRLSTFLDQLITDASERTEKWYGKQLLGQIATVTIPSDESKVDPGSLLDSIEGITTTIQQPFQTNYTSAPQQLPGSSASDSVRAELRRISSAEPMPTVDEDGTPVEMIELPGGAMVKARIRG